MCGARVVFRLQLLGFILASGVGMLATRDNTLQSTLLPGREVTGQIRIFSV